MKIWNTPGRLPCLLILLSISLTSQAAITPEPAGTETDSPAPMEITVRGSTNLSMLKRQVRAAEVEMYDIFNAINEDERYNIICREEASTGSRIVREQVCAPNFYHEAKAHEGRALVLLLQEDKYGSNLVPPASIVAHETRILKEKLEMAIAQHPELLEAIGRFNLLNEELEARGWND